MSRFLICAVIFLAAVCSAIDVGQDRVGVVGRRLKGSYGYGGGLDRAGFRGASDGHQGVRGLGGAGVHHIGEAGHGGVLGDGVKGVHGERVRSRIAGLKALSGKRGSIGGLHGGWAGQGASYGLGKGQANVGPNAETHGLGLGQVIANVHHGKGARVPRDVNSEDNIQGGVGKILAGALAGKDGVPQIVKTSLELGNAFGKSIGIGNIQGSAPVGAGGPGVLHSGAGLGPVGGWANDAGPQQGKLGDHGGAIGGPGVWNNGRGHIVGGGLVNLAPSGLDGSWNNNNGRVKVNPDGVIYIEDDGGPVIRGNLEWKDIGDGNFQWVEVGQNPVIEETPAYGESQGATGKQDSGQTEGADENQGAGQNQKVDRNQGGDEGQAVEQNKNSGQNLDNN